MVGGGGEGKTLPELLAAATAGRQWAWNALVDRYTPLLWSICRGYRLGEADAADVVQVTWLRLTQNVDRIQDPNRLAGWLGTTCRRECQALLRRSRRAEPVGDDGYLDRLTEHEDGPEERLLLGDRDQLLWRAFARLSERCQRVLRVLVAGMSGEDPPAYRDAAETLGVPIGALGPTRGRCLNQLRLLLDEAA